MTRALEYGRVVGPEAYGLLHIQQPPFAVRAPLARIEREQPGYEQKQTDSHVKIVPRTERGERRSRLKIGQIRLPGSRERGTLQSTVV